MINEDDLVVTSKTEAEMLAYDRLTPYLWNLRQRLEARISTEWVPGKRVELELGNEMEEAVAERLADEYRNNGWQVTVGGKRKDSATKWFVLDWDVLETK
jgi:hypothetical protein